MLTVTPPLSSLVIGEAAPRDLSITQQQSQALSQAATAAALMPVTPFDLGQTFFLHSNLGSSKTIYLDFDGFTTRNTAWNTPALQNIVTPPYDTDDDVSTFSDEEKLTIQRTWERVSEDFRPFDIDVTTQDPGGEALRNTSATDGVDVQWGIRIVIGGSSLDWYTPSGGGVAGGVAFIGSFSWDTDTPCFVFALETGGDDKGMGEAASHEVGHTLGLAHDGQTRFYKTSEDNAFHSKTDEYYAGHPAVFEEKLDPDTGDVTGYTRLPNLAPTGWVPIMGVAYYEELSQWSNGEYPNANNIQDDLAIITGTDPTAPENGVDYRIDDHGNSRQTSDALDEETSTTTSTVVNISGEGIIEQNTDVDYFSFMVDGLGEIVTLNISPFQTGPNLDVLAKLYNSSGTLIATSNPLDEVAAGSQTIDAVSGTGVMDGGWIDAIGQQITEFVLRLGTYYVSVEGTGKPITYIDPLISPGPILDPPGAPNNPQLLPDTSDWGYLKYGSLGYYSITGTRKTGLVVGVDFDVPGGASPLNWNLYTGGNGPEDTIKNLISEAGFAVPYELTVSTTGTAINTFDSDNGIDTADIPSHVIPLDDLDGFISAEDETLSFTWSNLSPSTVYQIYVFGHADFDAENSVTVTGGLWNGIQQTFNFGQDILADGLNVNENLPGDQDLSTFSLLVTSDVDGKIKIDVNNPPGSESAVAGLAIGTTKVGSISGTKWNDVNGNRAFDGSEDGLEGWTIYLDLNNNGQLDQTISPSQTLTQASTDIPQSIPDQNLVGVKSALDFAGVGIIEDVNVTLDITHSYDADLHAVLISPSGTRVKLYANVGANGDNFHNTVFDDSAALSIANQQAPFTGTFRPQEPLSAFNDEDAFGEWKLELVDDSVGDVGVLNSWSITVKLQGVSTYLEPVQITDVNGDYTFDFLQPGLYNVREYISPDQVLAGWKQTWAPAPFTLRSGSNLQNVDFGNWIPINQTGSISGQKYYDGNQDGVKGAEDPGLPGWIVYVDSNNNGVRDIASVPTVIASTDVPKAITDQHTTTSQISVNSVGTVFSVQVTLDITHSFVDDLDVYLVSPSGRSVELFTGVGGQYNDLHNLTLSDDAARSISTIGFNDLPYTGTWKPEGLLSDFGSEDAAGIWTLVVTDTANADEGTLNSWSLSITSGELFRTTLDDGTYIFDNLSPGNYTIREEPKPGWLVVPPTNTGIPAALWSGSGWDVTVDGTDDFTLPVPDSHRNVKNVDFGNFAPPGSISGYVYRDLDASATKAATEPGLPGWTVFIDANNNGTLDTGTVDTTVSSDAAEAINNFFTVSSQLWVGAMTSVSDVDLSLDITHTYDADLSAYLISPSGTRVKLISSVGGSGDNFQGTSFDDSALNSITSGLAPFSDVFKPAEPLSSFNGENATGYWTLEIKDSATGDDGSLNGWSLTIKGDELSTVTDDQGLYSFANLPPGTYHLDTIQIAEWTKTESAGAVTLLPSQTLLNANIGERPPYLQGDFNSDGVVDSADFLVWRRQSGTNVPNFSGADGDGDGDVDQNDFNLWRLNFGRYRDDHGNSAVAATSAALPASVGGKIEVAGDVDWFSFTATGGQLYRINATLGTLDAGNLQLFGTDGTTQLGANSGVSPFVDWTAPADGTYYAQVQSLNGLSVGTYTAAIAALIIDDHGNDAANATLAAVPSSTAGAIETAGDVDWFKFAATSSNSYSITAFLNTLPYAQIQVIGTNGVSVLQSTAAFSPSLVWTPPASGTYYIVVDGFSTTGSYSLSLAIDDHGNNSATASPYIVTNTVGGNIEGPYDVDWFSFSASANVQYTFQTSLTTLTDSTLTLWAPNGTTELAFNDDYAGGGLASLISWTAPSSGTYFIQVAGLGSAFGTYSLSSSVTPGAGIGSSLLLTQDEPESASSPASLVVSFVGMPQGAHDGLVHNAAKPVSTVRSASNSQNDLALLAWLANSTGGNRASSDVSLEDDDFSASRLCDEPESVDVAFELLEGNALVSAAI